MRLLSILFLASLLPSGVWAQGSSALCDRTPGYIGCLPSAPALSRSIVLPLAVGDNARRATTAQMLGQLQASDVTAALGSFPVTGAMSADLLAGKTSVNQRQILSNQTWGFFGSSTGACVQANTALFNGRCYVMAFDSPATISQYADRDTVGLAVANTGIPWLAFVTGSFTATTFVPSTPLPVAAVAKLRVGMLIDTNTGPSVWQIDSTRWTGQITGWAEDGTSITVSGWYRQTSRASPSPATIPVGQAAAAINPVTKVFGANINVFMPSNFYGNASGVEIGVFNSQAQTTTETSFPNVRGVDAVSLGDFDGTNAFTARAHGTSDFVSGFTAQSGRAFGFHDMPVNQSAGRVSFQTDIASGNAFAVKNPASGTFPFLVTAAGAVTASSVVASTMVTAPEVAAGNVGVTGTLGTTRLIVTGQAPPPSRLSPCNAGSIVPANDGYVYVCIYSGNWGRAALSADW